MAHLCHEIDDETAEITDSEKNLDDAEIFEQILVYDELSEKNYEGDSKLENIPISSVQLYFDPTTNEFWGACTDSGAQLTVIGQKQADAYIRQSK